MRVVLTTFDSRGGIEPLAALGVELRQRDIEAVVCAPPDCADRLTALGLPHVSLGRSVRELVHGSVPPSPRSVPQVAAALMAEQLEVLAPVAAECDAMVASGVMSFVAGARTVAELHGIRCEVVGFCPIYLPSAHHRPHSLPLHPVPADVDDPVELDAIDRRNYRRLFGPPLNAMRDRVGLPAVDDVRTYVLGRRPWLAADPLLAPWPGSDIVDPVQTGVWRHSDDRPLPEDVVSFLATGEAPVFVGLGSVRAPEGFAAATVEAVRRSGRRVLLSRGWAGLEPVDDGTDCLVVDEVNHLALFPRVAAVVHHGGAGTTATAARAGAPQVVVPQLADQPYFASRVAALGIGAAHPGPLPTVESLSTSLEAALRPDVRTRCRAVAGRIITDGAAVAAALLADGNRSTDR